MNRTNVAHSLIEDAYAMAVGCIMIATGLAILRAGGLVTGGMAGIALLIAHFVPVTPGLLFAALNLPFLLLAWYGMDSLFALRSLAVSVGIAALSVVAAGAIDMNVHNHGVAAIGAGILLGMGTLALVRHGAGVGGIGIVAVWLYQSRGWNAGRSQILIDMVILGASAFFLPSGKLIWSAVSAVAMGSVVYLWHRPGLYAGVSPQGGRANRQAGQPTR